MRNKTKMPIIAILFNTVFEILDTPQQFDNKKK